MKVALITGAARGIGAATATAFAEAGYALAILDKDGVELRRAATQLEESGTDVLALETDLRSLEQIEEAVRQTAERFGRIDVLINNAATRALETIREITPENWQLAVDVNLTAPAFLFEMGDSSHEKIWRRHHKHRIRRSPHTQGRGGRICCY